jgi:DNA-binding IclR family transcriptional regulator
MVRADGEYSPGACGIAAPVFTRNQAAAALAISRPPTRAQR